MKTASTLKTFSSKIKSAQDEETLTPDVVKEIAEEIMDVAEVATELAEEIADGVPAEERNEMGEEEPRQIEVAADETDEEKKKRMEREAQDKDDDDKKELKEKVANLTKELGTIRREATLEKLAAKYASLFPKQMHEAKEKEIKESKEDLKIVEAKVQEASDIITNKTMVKIASLTDSVFDITDSSEEVNIASKL